MTSADWVTRFCSACDLGRAYACVLTWRCWGFHPCRKHFDMKSLMSSWDRWLWIHLIGACLDRIERERERERESPVFLLQALAQQDAPCPLSTWCGAGCRLLSFPSVSHILATLALLPVHRSCFECFCRNGDKPKIKFMCFSDFRPGLRGLCRPGC